LIHIPTDCLTAVGQWTHGGEHKLLLKGAVLFNPKTTSDTILSNTRKISFWKQSRKKKKIPKFLFPYKTRTDPKSWSRFRFRSYL